MEQVLLPRCHRGGPMGRQQCWDWAQCAHVSLPLYGCSRHCSYNEVVMIALAGGEGVRGGTLSPYPGGTALPQGSSWRWLSLCSIVRTSLTQHLSERVLPSLALLGRGSCWPPNEPDIN